MVMATEPSVRVSSWYLWTRISRRALTCLEQQPGVDPDRLGIFGVSMGGTIVWPLAAMDRRVAAACAIYGVGWLDVYVRAPRTLRVVMHEKEFAIGWTQYEATVDLEPDTTWRTITLPAKVFLTDKGEHLKSWREVQQLELRTMGGAGEEPIYGAFRWLPGR
jgi:pimeloyl-ACP methyl ester carboxylesterase